MSYLDDFNPIDKNIPQVLVIDWIEQGSRVLEIGCAGGRVSRLIKAQKRAYIHGVDINKEYVELARRFCDKTDLLDVNQPESVLQLDIDKFDYVLLLDVLEHLGYPNEVLTNMVTHARSDLAYILAIPNFLVWNVRLKLLFGFFSYSETGVLDRSHLRFFSRTEFEKLISESGLQVVKHQDTWDIPALNILYRLTRKLTVTSKMFIPLLDTIRRLGNLIRATMPGLFTKHFVVMAKAK